MYAGSCGSGDGLADGGVGGMYATANERGRGSNTSAIASSSKSSMAMRPSFNSLRSVSGETRMDRSGTLQLVAAQQGVAYTVPMEQGAPNPAQGTPSKAAGASSAAALIPQRITVVQVYGDAGNDSDSEL